MNLFSFQFRHEKEDPSILKKTEKKKNKLGQQQMLDYQIALNEAFIIAETDLYGKITYVNDRFCVISGYSRDELIGQTHRIISSSYHSKQFFEDLWETISSGKIWEGEIRNRAKNGSYYWVNTTIIPFRNSNGEVYKYVSIRYEITNAKELQNKLNEQVVFGQKAANSSELKSRFIAELSHEIRSGLSNILGFSDLLERPNLEEDQKYFLSKTQSLRNNRNENEER